MGSLLNVKDLHYSFRTYGGEVHAVRGASFEVNKGEILGIVGESGSGKTVMTQAIIKLNLEPPGIFKSGQIIFNGEDLTKYSKKQMRDIRGKEISMIFQDPMTSLNPTMKIGKQIAEVLRKIGYERSKINSRIEETLEMVRISDVNKRMNQYPFELSGGMMQRVMIAMALSTNPDLIIADEPTTSLDVTIEAQVIQLLKKLQTDYHKSVIVISHNLGVVATLCDKIAVMYGGKIVEKGTADDIFYNPKHPYTWGLLRSIPGSKIAKDQKLIPINGTPPDLFSPPVGCSFAARCKYAMKICFKIPPLEYQVDNGHYASCWLEHEIAKSKKIVDSVKMEA